MIGLSDHGLRRRFGQRGSLLQRLMKAFPGPALLLEGGEVVEGQRGVAGDQIPHPRATVSGCEDWLDPAGGGRARLPATPAGGAFRGRFLSQL